jgi:hypothetical protein
LSFTRTAVSEIDLAAGRVVVADAYFDAADEA